MVREANRGAVIPTAGGERGLGQGWVCGGQIPPPFQFSDSNTDDWDNRPYLWESLRLKVKRRKRIGPGVGVRGPHLVPLCPKTYARSFPRVGIVRFRAPALVPLCPRPMPDPFQELGLCAFAHLHWSPFAPRPMPDPFQEKGLCAFAHLHSPP
jgi:hypothetical protein